MRCYFSTKWDFTAKMENLVIINPQTQLIATGWDVGIKKRRRKMCKLISGVYHKQKGLVVSKDTDSHSDILSEFGISDTKRSSLFAKTELIPKHCTTLSEKDFKKWAVVIDEKNAPDWLNLEMLTNAWKNWFREHNIKERYKNFKGDIDLSRNTGLTSISNLKSNRDIYLYDCTNLTCVSNLKAGGHIFLNGCTKMIISLLASYAIASLLEDYLPFWAILLIAVFVGFLVGVL